MDKETLANYGWIVITLIVMMFLILLATPLGDYVGKTATNVKNGVMSVADKADYDKEKEDMNELFDGDDTGHGADINQNAVKPSDKNNNSNNKTTYLMGDVNKDGRINAMDASYINNYLYNMDLKNGREIKEQWYNNETATLTSTSDGSKSTVVTKFDKSSQTITLNGTMAWDTQYISNLITIPTFFKEGDTYELKLEYISGSASTPDAGVNGFNYSPACIALDFYRSASERDFENRHSINVRLPKVNGVASTNTETLTVTASDAKKCKSLALIIYSGDNAVQFNNYKVKIGVRKMKDTERVDRANNLSNRILFQNRNDYGVTQSWDSSSHTLTLNGSLAYNTQTQGFGFTTQVDYGAQYKLTLTYIGGTATAASNNANYYTCMAMDVAFWDLRRMDAIKRTRNFCDTYLPNLKSNGVTQPTTTTCTEIMDAAHSIPTKTEAELKSILDKTVGFCFSIYSGNDKTTFNNYKIKVEVERLDKISARKYQKDKAGNDILSLDLAVADCDGDGQITEADNIILYQYLADWDSAKEIMRKAYEKYN